MIRCTRSTVTLTLSILQLSAMLRWRARCAIVMCSIPRSSKARGRRQHFTRGAVQPLPRCRGMRYTEQRLLRSSQSRRTCTLMPRARLASTKCALVSGRAQERDTGKRHQTRDNPLKSLHAHLA